jgi:excisionase family DNA binding protein
MTRNRRPDWRRIKGKLSYTIDEAARALGTHRNTVRHWVKKAGLPAMTESRPHLILGAELVAFLQARRASRKRPCGAGELYCLRCREPRRPVPGLLEYRPLTSTRGRIVGICSTCEAILHRFVSTRRATAVAAEFNLQIEVRHESLVDSALLALNCDSSRPTPR